MNPEQRRAVCGGMQSTEDVIERYYLHLRGEEGADMAQATITAALSGKVQIHY